MSSPRNLLLVLLVLLAQGLLAAPVLRAQTTTVSSLADYAGPRCPGGPETRPTKSPIG